METLISDRFLRYSDSPSSQSLSAFNFRSSFLKNRIFPPFSSSKWCWASKRPKLCSISAYSASNSKDYGGWEDLKPLEDSFQLGKLDQFQNFLISVGIDDRKHAFMFLLGLVSALAITRVRISSVIVFPASVLVFAVGFSLGFVRGGSIGSSVKEVSINGSRKTPKEENYVVSSYKLRNLVDFFRELDVKISNLKNEMKGAIDSNFIEMGELESYIEVLESIGLSVLPVKISVESSINNLGLLGDVGESSTVLVEEREIEKNSNQKPSRRRKELGGSGFDFFRYLGGLFQENSVGVKHNKVKDIVKREFMEQLNSKEVNGQIQGDILGHEEEKVVNPVSDYNAANMNIGSLEERSNLQALDKGGAEKSGDTVRRMEVNPGQVKQISQETFSSGKKVPNTEEFSYQYNSLRFMNSNAIFLETAHQNKNGTAASHSNPPDLVIPGINVIPRRKELDSLSMEAEASLQHEQTLNTSNGAYMPSHSRDSNENGTYRSYFREERVKSKDPHPLHDQQSAHNMEGGSTSSSAMISDDVAFDRYLTEATDLLKQARECLRGKADEERAEIMLYKSAKLLSRAIGMKPMSLLAVGQLGNTFLLHGELKLKISRELRTLLSKSNISSSEKRSRVQCNGLDDQLVSKDRITSVLIDVCEECEELLVEAGRKYRMALSIDGNDVRALYNWGLALSYRAQLIADVGPVSIVLYLGCPTTWTWLSQFSLVVVVLICVSFTNSA